MNICEFDNELLRTGEHEDLYFRCPSYDDFCFTIDLIEYRNNTLFLKHTYRCDDIFKTCIGLSIEIERMELGDDVEIQFVIEEIDGVIQYFSQISIPFKKSGNNVIIEVNN
jgi:hypothetical protein